MDAALNDEIEGALMSAEADLKGGAVGDDVSAASPGDVSANDEDIPEVATTKMPKQSPPPQQSDWKTSSWDNLKETLYEAADATKPTQAKKKNLNPPSFAADYTPVPPETPGEKAMKEWSAIDVVSDASGNEEGKFNDQDEKGKIEMMSPEERMLLAAQKEAEEAEAMLREAELESARIEMELEMFAMKQPAVDMVVSTEKEMVVEGVPPSSPSDEDGEDALASMAEAYQAALDAANDNVNLLTAQIEELEEELTSAVKKMESAQEDKERVSAEYAYLASNYKGYKAKMDKEGEELREQLDEYTSKVESLEEQLTTLKNELSKAQEEASKWKTDYESIQSEMSSQLQSSLKEQKDLQATLDDVTSTFETTLEESQKEYEASLSAVTTQYDLALSQSKKMIAALRTSLRNTRAEVQEMQSESQTSSEEVERAVEDVRSKMNDEVEKLRGALKGLEGREGENEDVLRKEREEREKLLEEIK